MHDPENKEEQSGVTVSPGFRFMGLSLGALLELKSGLRRRLGYLERNRNSISAFVYEKLRQEYNSYLVTVDSELALNLCEYEIKLAEVRLFSSQLRILRKNHSDNIEEIKLRYRIGEYGEDEYRRLIRDHEERMRRFEESLDRYGSEEKKIRAFLEQAGDEPKKDTGMTASVSLQVEIPEETALPGETETGELPEMVFRIEDGPGEAGADIRSETVRPEATEDSKARKGPPEHRPVSAMLEIRDSVKTAPAGSPDLSELMEAVVDDKMETQPGGDLSVMPGLEDVLSGESVNQRTAPEGQVVGTDEPTAAGESAPSAEDIFAAMMEETGREIKSTREAGVSSEDADLIVSQAAETGMEQTPGGIADELATPVTPESAPAAGQTDADRLERDLDGIFGAVSHGREDGDRTQDAVRPTGTVDSPGGLDLDELMSGVAIPEPPVRQDETAEAEPEQAPAAVELPEPAFTRETGQSPGSEVHMESLPPQDEEDLEELRWEPLPVEHGETVPGQSGEPVAEKKDDHAATVRRPVPPGGKIELTLDLDRNGLDPQKMLTVNQTIDAIRKKTVECPNCGTMNYAIRWYCESCEATLTTL